MAAVEYTSTGKYTLNQLAQSHGMTVHQLINSSIGAQANPGLAKYIGQGNFNLPLPAGVPVTIPADHWRA